MSLSRISVLAPLVAAALIAPLPPLPDAVAASTPPSPTPSAVPACGRTEGEGAPGTSWSPTSTRFGEAGGYDPYVGNGYLGHRIPATGTGYAATGEKTGWPLYTPRYGGAFVSGLYARDKAVSEGREVIAALPSWTTVEVGVGDERFGTDTPAGRISHYRQTVFLSCGLVRTSLRWTTADGRATDLTYDVLADRSDVHTGAVRLRMTPRWSGTATVTGRLDERGARRIILRKDGTFRTLGTGVEGAVAQTMRRGSGVVETLHPESRTAPKPTPVREGRTYTFEKYVGVDTALTSPAPAEDAREAAHRAARRGWDRIFAANERAWRGAWS
ncbi:haloacid dehalogenase, partial [Streptomyces sp. ZEA17I]